MPVRIYALAKELKLDSKVLVDICPKAGVSGKGSALASLTDDEADKVRAFISGGGSRPTSSSAAKAAPTPPSPGKLTSSRVPTLIAKARPRADSVEPAESPDSEVEETVVAATAVEKETEKETETPPTEPQSSEPPPVEVAAKASPDEAPSPKTPTTKKPAAPAPTRPDFSNSPMAGKLKTLTARAKARAEGGKKSPDSKGDGDSGPVIRVAKLPPSKQPPATPAKKEPTPQKPDIKLPIDAIRKSGGALKDRVREIETRRREAEKKTPEKAGERETTTARGRRGKGGAAAPATGDAEPMSREARKQKRQRSRAPGRAREREREPARRPRRSHTFRRRKGVDTAKPRKSNVVVQLPCTVKSFCEAVGEPVSQALRVLLVNMSTPATINSTLDQELAELLASEMGVEVDFRQPLDAEDQLLNEYESFEDDPADLQPRPPVVTFLGHVDHGKTSLLDRIMDAKVVDGEAGGITQHIRAYKVGRGDRTIAFVDTPGHEAFTEMRARGANVTDVAVLVVAADDGVMPQTEEAISHAQAAGVPIVVALNKMDLPGVDLNRIMQQLAGKDLLPSEWGGETEVVQCSAMTGLGVDDLLDTLLTIAELHEYKANLKRPATGTCIEAERHEQRGVMAKVLVQNGTLKLGDCIVCGSSYGRVQAMFDTIKPKVKLKKAGPSTPVNITGLDEVPGAGDRFYVTEDVTQAREIAEKRRQEQRQTSLVGRQHISLDTIFQKLEGLGQDEVQTLNIILRADVRGSIEALEKELTKLDHPEVQVNVLQALVGGVTEADVHLADASDAIIIGFNVVPDEGARNLAKQQGVEIRRYDIIYRVTEDLRAALEGMLRPEEYEVEMGSALVQRVFTISRLGAIAGCRVVRGLIKREPGVRVRVIRNSTIIGDYPLESLRREKDDAREVREGLECGIKLAGFNDVKEGDLLDVYKIAEKARKLEN